MVKVRVDILLSESEACGVLAYAGFSAPSGISKFLERVLRERLAAELRKRVAEILKEDYT